MSRELVFEFLYRNERCQEEGGEVVDYRTVTTERDDAMNRAMEMIND